MLFSNGIIGRYHEDHKLLVSSKGVGRPKWVRVKNLKEDSLVISQLQETNIEEFERDPYIANILREEVVNRDFFSNDIEEINKLAHVCNAKGHRTHLKVYKRTWQKYRLSVVDEESVKADRWARELEDNFDDLGYTYPVSVVSKTPVLDTIYAFEVPGHQYVSNGMISHNSLLYGGNYRTLVEKLKVEEGS